MNKTSLLLVTLLLFTSCLRSQRKQDTKLSEFKDLKLEQVLTELNPLASEFMGASTNFKDNNFVWCFNNRIEVTEVREKGLNIYLFLSDTGESIKWDLVLKNQKFVPTSITALNDTSFLMEGLYCNSEVNKCFYTLKYFNSKGDEIWSKLHTVESNSAVYANTNLLVEADKFLWSICNGDRCILYELSPKGIESKEKSLKFDNEEIAFSKFHNMGFNDYSYSLFFTDSTSDVEDEKFYASTLKLDKNFDKIQRGENYFLDNISITKVLEQKNSKSYYALGYKIDGSEQKKLHIINFDEYFVPKWRINYQDLYSAFSKPIYSLDVNSSTLDRDDNLLMTGGIIFDDDSYKVYTFFLKLNSESKVLKSFVNYEANSSNNYGILLLNNNDKLPKLLTYSDEGEKNMPYTIIPVK